MKICIVSDSHDRAEPLAAAIAEAQAAGAQAVIHQVWRSHPRSAWQQHWRRSGAAPHEKTGGLFTYHGQEAVLELGGRKIFVTHMPNHGRAFACTGDYDLVCHGHSHTAHVGMQADVEGGQCWLVNPGSVAGIDAPGVEPIPTWILGDLDRMSFEIRTLSHTLSEA